MQNRRRLVSRVSSNRWQHVAAIAAQRNVIAKEAARLKRDGGGLGVNLAYSEMVLGTIGKVAGNRNLACSSWGSAEARFARVEKMGKLLEFQATLLKDLRLNSARCKSGASLSATKILR
jgi:eukaryotic-like serine/threonine-protein kinase